MQLSASRFCLLTATLDRRLHPVSGLLARLSEGPPRSCFDNLLQSGALVSAFHDSSAPRPVTHLNLGRKSGHHSIQSLYRQRHRDALPRDSPSSDDRLKLFSALVTPRPSPKRLTNLYCRLDSLIRPTAQNLPYVCPTTPPISASLRTDRAASHDTRQFDLE